MDIDRPPPASTPSRSPARARTRPVNHPNNYCARRKFVRPPLSCAPRRATRVAQSSPTTPSTPLATSGAPPPTARPPVGNVRLAGAAAALPTASGTRFEAIVAAAPHSQLIALGLVVALVSSGLLIARLRKGAPKTTGSKASRKQKDHALRKIMQAQAASNTADEIAPSTANTQASGSGSGSGSGDRDRVRAATGSASSKVNGTGNPESDASRRPVLSRVNTAVGGSIAAAAELLPSPACVTSSSAVIWNGLERIGSALNATASRARSGSLSGGSSAVSTKGKEREADRGGVEDEVSAQMRRRDSTRSSGSHTPPVADGAGRRSKGKKGKNPTGGSSSQMMSPSTSSQGFTSALTSPAISRRGSEKGDSGRLPDRTAAVQPLSSLPGDFPIGEPRRIAQQKPDALAPIQPPARLEKPPDPKPPLPPVTLPKQTSDAFVQTSPRLLPLPASPPLPPSDSDATPPPTLPPAARSISPLTPFDLHASFQATTALPSATSSEPPLSLNDYLVTNATAYLSAAVSPPISPSMSCAPSAAESASSNSPIPARASSPMLGSPPITHARPLPPAFGRRGSAVSVNGHLAVGTLERTPSGSSSPALPAARSRKAARKASANETALAGQQGVVGLPGAVAAPRRSSEADPNRSVKGGKSPKDDTGGSNPSLRRASATSSGASANSGGKGAGSSAGDDPYQHHHHPQQQRWPAPGDRIYGYPALGLRNDEDDDLPSEGGSELDRRSSSAAGEGHLPAGFSSRSNHFMSPETSPHPSQRSVSSSQYTPSNQRTPWSPHMTSQYAPVAGSPSAHSASRPPSRGSSLSVPVAMTPLSAAGPTPHQQALALAQSQLQTQSQIMLQYQHMQAVQQRQSHSSQGPTLRRRATSGGLSETSDGLLSPTTTATPATPNGFGFPIGVLTSPLMGSSPSVQPGWSAHSSGLGPHMMPYSSGPSSPYLGLSQTSSPTTASFPSGAFTPQMPPHAILAHPNGMYQSANSGGGGYFAPPSGQASSYGPMQPSPTTAYFSATPTQQQQRNNSLPHPSRPRLSSSMSASGVHGAAAGKASNSAGSGNATSRSQVERSQSIPSAPLSGGVPLGDPPPSGWKGKLKQAEQDADRMGKELEIARWRLTVVEEEQRAAERENQEALKALAARAMRAEARIKLYETAAGRSEAAEEPSPIRAEPINGASTPFEGSPPTQAAAAPPRNETADEEAVVDDSIKIERSTTIETLPTLQLNGSASADELSESSLDKPTHPLAWLDLDAISFGNSRPLRQTGTSPTQSSPRLAASRRRNGRSSLPAGESSRRRPNGGLRRKSALNVQAPPAAEAELSDDEEIVIVLDAPLRRRPIPTVLPSRRSSFMDDDGIERDGNSVYDDEDVPLIDMDDGAEPLAGGLVVGEVGEDVHEHPAYIGFLPSYLSGSRVPPPTANPLPTKVGEGTLLEEEASDAKTTPPEVGNPEAE